MDGLYDAICNEDTLCSLNVIVLDNLYFNERWSSIR